MLKSRILQSVATLGVHSLKTTIFFNSLLGRKGQTLILALLFLLPMACTKKQSADGNLKTLRVALAEEPPSLHSAKATDQVSFFILGHVMEGLLRYDENMKLAPGVAEKWDLNDKNATFYLRKDAKWSDGSPVRAGDFQFSWRLAVDPKTASEYAFFLYPVKNAEKINKGELAVEQLGVQVVDDWTLKVEFERPCGYFLSLLSFATYMPIREDFYKKVGDRYAADANTMLYNGPFRLSQWVHAASLRMDKNEYYWKKSDVHLDRIDAPYITSDTSTRFNLFKDKKIDFVSLDADTMKDAISSKFQVKKFSTGSVFYLEFNHRKDHVTRNLNLRKALQYVFDPKELVDKVIAVPGNLPGVSLFPVWLPGVKGTFRAEYEVKPWAVDLEKAKKYLELAKKELGVEKIPALVYLTGESPTAVRQAEYFQSLYSKTLGIELKIDKQTFKQRLAKMTTGEFDVVAAGWGPDYSDPMTFADLFSSWNLNNRGRYESKEYDKLVREALATSEPKKRMGAMGKIQDLILKDLPILPQYEAGEVFLVSDRVSGVQRVVVGADPNYIHAKIME